MTDSLILYSTEGCHLCDVAKQLVWTVLQNNPKVSLAECDIANDEALMNQFALSIPVIFNPESQRSFAWPFDEQQVQELISILQE